MKNNEAAMFERLSVIESLKVDWKSRTVWLLGDIQDEQVFALLPKLKLLDETKGDIKVVISSNGGSAAAGFAILGVLRTLKNQVITEGYGNVYSIAALILQGGNVRRLAPSAEFMMHNGVLSMECGHGLQELSSEEIQTLAADAQRHDGRYHKVFVDRCTNDEVDLPFIQRACDEERFFSAEEAVDLGLADEIIEPEE